MVRSTGGASGTGAAEGSSRVARDSPSVTASPDSVAHGGSGASIRGPSGQNSHTRACSQSGRQPLAGGATASPRTAARHHLHLSHHGTAAALYISQRVPCSSSAYIRMGLPPLEVTDDGFRP